MPGSMVLPDDWQQKTGILKGPRNWYVDMPYLDFSPARCKAFFASSANDGP